MKTKRLQVRFSDNDLFMLDLLCHFKGLNRSDYIRSILVDEYNTMFNLLGKDEMKQLIKNKFEGDK